MPADLENTKLRAYVPTQNLDNLQSAIQPYGLTIRIAHAPLIALDKAKLPTPIRIEIVGKKMT